MQRGSGGKSFDGSKKETLTAKASLLLLSVFFLQQLHHAAHERGLLLAQIGDVEKALLTEYPEALYCIAADESELYDGYSDESGYSEPAYDFDRAYVWQPQTPQDDGNYDVRDIAFYLKDGTVSAITMTKPYAFRFAYGVDRDAALRLAEENRSALCGQ